MNFFSKNAIKLKLNLGHLFIQARNYFFYFGKFLYQQTISRSLYNPHNFDRLSQTKHSLSVITL